MFRLESEITPTRALAHSIDGSFSERAVGKVLAVVVHVGVSFAPRPACRLRLIRIVRGVVVARNINNWRTDAVIRRTCQACGLPLTETQDQLAGPVPGCNIGR